MNESSDILTLIGIPGELISSYQVITEEHNTFIKIEFKDVRSFCPFCHSRSIEIKDYYIRRMNNSIVKHNNIIIEARQRRYKCKKCGKTFNQEIKLIDKNASITNAVKRSILDDLKTPTTLTSIANNYDISPTTVMTIFDKGVLPQKRGKMPEALCIDEFCFGYRRGFGKFPAVISNYETGEIIDIVPSRWKSHLEDFFKNVPPHELKQVKYFMSDMNDTYRSIKRKYFPNAAHIIDMFHIAKQFTEAVQVIRKRIMNEEKDNEKTKQYRYLKKNYKLFLMHQDELIKKSKTDVKHGIVYDLLEEVTFTLKKYPELNKAYQAKEDFYFKTLHPLYWQDAEKLIDFFINQFENSNIKELVSIGNTFKKWKFEITCTLAKNDKDKRLSNAVAEGNNNYIQTLIDMSYGLLDFDRARKRILYMDRNKKTRRN